MITVISTGFAHKEKAACIASVKAQKGVTGPDRVVFNREAIYVYNTRHTESMARNPAEMKIANAIESAARAAPPYEGIDAL